MYESGVWIMPNEPLGLPKGSVRAILAIIVTGSCIGGLILRPESGTQILPALTAILAFYFGSRSTSDGAGGQ